MKNVLLLNIPATATAAAPLPDASVAASVYLPQVLPPSAAAASLITFDFLEEKHFPTASVCVCV